MVEKVECWRSSDGRIFETEAAAAKAERREFTIEEAMADPELVGNPILRIELERHIKADFGSPRFSIGGQHSRDMNKAELLLACLFTGRQNRLI